MGSAVGAAYRAGGRRVVTTVAGRSARTRGLAEQAGLELVPDLDAVVAASELVLSIAPPDQAGATAAAIAAPPGGPAPVRSSRTGTRSRRRPRASSSGILADGGLELVDGSISGGPPRADYRTRVYLSGAGRPSSRTASPAWIEPASSARRSGSPRP